MLLVLIRLCHSVVKIVDLLRQTITFQGNVKDKHLKRFDSCFFLRDFIVEMSHTVHICRMNYQPLFEFIDKPTVSSADSNVDNLYSHTKYVL